MGTIELGRDTGHVVVASADGLHVVGSDPQQASRQIAVDALHAFTTLGRRLWVVAGSPPVLRRYELDTGRELPGPIAVPPPIAAARLVVGSSASVAIWVGGGSLVQLVEDGAQVVATELAAELDFVLPVSVTRAVWCQRQGVSLREGTTTRWSDVLAGEGKVIDGALLSEGRAVALVVQRGDSHTIVVIALHDGTVRHRIRLASVSAVRFAHRRGAALVLVERRRLVLIDLRFGRVIADREVEHDVGELAIDPAGQRIAMRLAGPYGEVQEISVRDLLDASQLEAAKVSAITPESSAPVAASLAPPPVAAPSRDPFHATRTLDRLDALPRRPVHARATEDENLAWLAAQRERALSWVTLAIARAWDQGRIAFPNMSALPFSREVDGVVGTLRGLALEHLAAAERRTVEAAEALAAVVAALAPRATPLAAFAQELALSPLACDVLLAAAAPVMWGELARLYGVLSNDEARPLCDEQLVISLLSDVANRYQIAAELESDAPLIRYGVIRPGPGFGRPFLPLTVDPVVLKILRGASPINELAPVTVPRRAGCRFEDLRVRGELKDRAVQDLARARAPLRLAIRGRVGAGRHTMLAAIAAIADRELGVIDATAMMRHPGSGLVELQIALERCHLAGLLPCIDGLDLVPSDDVSTREQIRETLRRHPGPLAVRVGWEARPLLEPGHVLIDLPAPSLSERMAAWEASLATSGLRVADVAELADRYAVGPGVVERVCAEVAAADREAGHVADDAGVRLDQAVRQHLESRLGTTANRVHRLSSWAQVILPTDILDSITELVSRIRNRRTVYDLWGYDRVMATSRGVTALFQGGPGTGKTLVASAIANELGMDLYRVDLSRVVSKWIGETEQNLAKLFDAAEDGNAIILFDEADSLFAKRTEVKSSVDRYANLEVNYLLQRFDTFEGIAILTTNFGTSIDNAFKRRLSLRLTFPFPDEEQRERLWRAHMPPEAPFAGEFQLAEIAQRYRLSGGYIRNCALRAAFLAAEEGGGLTSDHFERAIKAEFREIGKFGESGVLE